MSESSPIKDALYAKIEDIGQEQIHQLLLNDKFSELFERIYEPVIQSIQNIDEYEKHGTLAESLTHYLFTEMLIPSQRKITFENIELDMIIPNTTELQKDSQNNIIIFFVKTSIVKTAILLSQIILREDPLFVIFAIEIVNVSTEKGKSFNSLVNLAFIKDSSNPERDPHASVFS